MNHSAYKVVAVFLFVSPLIVLFACEAQTRTIGGKSVRNVKEYYALWYGAPFRGRESDSYWVYLDSTGTPIKHGPYQHFSGDGRLEYEANYLDGKQEGTATTWNVQGEITGQTFWRKGQNIGWANFRAGHLDYAIESLFEGDREVGTKKFERGQWTLGFICGNRIDLAINAQTGALMKLQTPSEIACQ